MSRPALIPPEKGISLWSKEGRKKIIAVTSLLSAPFLFWLLLWAIGQFLQVRGIISMLISRILLAIAWVAGTLFIVAFALAVNSVIKRDPKALRKLVMWLSAAWAVVIVGLDRLLPPQQVTTIATKETHERPSNWRTINDWQKVELVPILERFPNYTLHILASSVSEEPLDYAMQFKELFAAHHWKVIGPETIPSDEIALNMQLSISDQYWSRERPEAFTAIDSQLRFIGVKSAPNFVVDPLAHPDELVMWIGPQTPPGYPQHIPLQLGKVCRDPLQFTDDTMHFLPGNGKDFVRWARIKPRDEGANFVAGQRIFVLLTGAARSVVNTSYFKVQALGAAMPRPDALDVTLTKDLSPGEQLDLKIISDEEIRVKCVDSRS